jgi:hypothetical protein
MVLGLFVMLTVNAGTAFATKWVQFPRHQGRLYVDADSAVKQGSTLIYWSLLVANNNNVGVNVAKWAFKIEVDLRTPRKFRRILNVEFDANDQILSGPSNELNFPWEATGDNPDFDFALSLAKEGRDTGSIPAPTSDR